MGIVGDFAVAVGDADQYRIAVAGVIVSLGPGQSAYAEDEFFTAVQKNDSFGVVEGADGTVARFKTNSRLVEMSLTFLGTGAVNDYLSALLFADVNQPNGAGIGSFVVEDLQGTTMLSCSKAWIQKPADFSLGRAVKMRKWPFVGVWSIWNIGSN